jgi:hypothetical protein
LRYDKTLLILLLFSLSLFGVDFDIIVVGTSPFSLFEALYQSHSGKKVLILEEAAECGGAWKSIPVCGLPHVDLGCHQIGSNVILKAFLEDYAGCKMVPHETPTLPFPETSLPNDFYFSQGCYELIDHLLQLIATTDIVLLTNTRLDSVSIDPSHTMAIAHTQAQDYSTSKLIVTPMSCFDIQAPGPEQLLQKSKYYHLYLLIQDPTPPRFSYHQGEGNGVSRIVNLTHFASLAETGQQLLVFQVHDEKFLLQGQTFLDALKAKDLIAKEAYILKSDPYIYETGTLHQNRIRQLPLLFEILQTGHFNNLSNYISKWKQVLQPFRQAITLKS